MTTIHDRILEILPALQVRLRCIASTLYPVDELVQHAVLKIYDRAEKDPEFIQQKNNYLIQYGYWMAMHCIEAGGTYNRFMGEIDPAGPDKSDEYKDIPPTWDIIPSDEPDPARAVEERETLNDLIATVRRMSPDNQIIVKMMYYGVPQAQIASKFNVTSQAIKQRKNTIANQLYRFAPQA